MKVVVCGGGVIGSSIAYFLSKRGAEVTVVERTGVANASSGKAGAFLALDWCAGSPLDRLARRSFALHAELPNEIDADWGYQRVTTYGAYAVPGRGSFRRGGEGPSWLVDGVTVTGQLGSTATTAMVHPRLFTEALIGAAQARGATLRIGRVTDVVRDDAGSRVRGVEVDGSLLEADAVVVAMGPWSIAATGWLPLPGVHAYKGHSLIFETGTSVPPEALFLEFQDRASGAMLTPEVFPRADGTTYVAMSSSQTPLPEDPAEVQTDRLAVDLLEVVCERISPAFAREKILVRQACYRPMAQDGLPLLGKVPGVEGAYVATGHSVWGVLNGPATGEAMAELIVDGAARTTDLRAFDPGRFRPLDPRKAG